MQAPPSSPPLPNRAQAERVMGRHGFDGLVAALPANVQYLSGHVGAGRDVLAFAVLPRRDAEPAALVLDAAELRTLAGGGGTWMPNVVSYTAPLDPDRPADGGARSYEDWPVRTGAEPSASEREWLDARERLAEPAASALLALARAVRDAGLARATLGTDDPRVERWLRAASLADATCVHAEHAFREIRRVKTPDEIALLRVAARVNEIACLEAVAQVHDGAEWLEIENHYVAEMANRGGRGERLSCGPAGLPHGRVRRGEPTVVDAFGRWRGYAGAFGRTLVVGDPSADLLRRNAAMQRGWAEAVESVRPGLTYRELATRCVEAVRRAGFPEFSRAVPHALGLERDEDPAPPTLAGRDRGDPVLEPGVVLGVELPFVEIGWGSVHLEDTLLVRADGCETLTSMQTDLLLVP